MELIEYLSYTELLSWIFPAFIASIFLYIIIKTKFGELYRQKHLDAHFRSVGLVSLVLCLLYLSFFVDKTQLTSDADTKRVSLESDISLLETVLPAANEEYALLVSQIGELRSMASGDYDKGKIYNYLSEVESRLRSLNDKVDGARARIITQGFGSGGSYFGGSLELKSDPVASKIVDLDRQLSRIRETKKLLEVVYSGNLREIKVATAKYKLLEESKYSENIYYSMRALSLGGLGALITLLASYILVDPRKPAGVSFIQSNNYWSLVLGYTLMGGVISIVVFGLFYTKQLTIFQADTSSVNSVPPEYWRVTMLCIIAGAFSEKLYSAASNRVDKYVEEPEPNNTIQPTDKSGG